ncbi:hypothetical protein PNOK_0418900 [Pyrrhoderma noxium]|uniref:Uncharacterized protein n=1 Tax=Pyrrhoderma noxium TaxID=2282107 RepID=A0A286UI08_9AGAM|nr:hypothetical protein PNOK_0418900 [Pyrrhoderma noxium]
MFQLSFDRFWRFMPQSQQLRFQLWVPDTRLDQVSILYHGVVDKIIIYITDEVRLFGLGSIFKRSDTKASIVKQERLLLEPLKKYAILDALNIPSDKIA